MDQHSSTAPLTGLAFVVLLVGAFLVGGETPAGDAPPAQLADFYADEERRLHFGGAILTVAIVFFVFFLGALRALLRSAGEAGERLSAIAFGGGLIAAVGLLSWSGFTLSIVFALDAAPEAIQAVHMLSSGFFTVVAGGLAALLIATGALSLRAQLLPRWLSWITLLIGVLAVTPAGYGALLAFVAWTAIVSVMLWRRPPAARLEPAGS